MRGIDARIEDRDRHAGAVVAGRPRLIGLDERHALRQRRPDDHIVHHADDVGVERFEGRERWRVDVEGDVRKRLILMDQAVRRRRASLDSTRSRCVSMRWRCPMHRGR